MVSKEDILKRIKKDMREKGFLNKYSGCMTKKRQMNCWHCIPGVPDDNEDYQMVTESN